MSLELSDHSNIWLNSIAEAYYKFQSDIIILTLKFCDFAKPSAWSLTA